MVISFVDVLCIKEKEGAQCSLIGKTHFNIPKAFKKNRNGKPPKIFKYVTKKTGAQIG